jgi:hypothetical protein
MVTYIVQPGGIEVTQWAPKTYYSLGQMLEAVVQVRVFVAKQGGLRYSLEIPSADGSF